MARNRVVLRVEGLDGRTVPSVTPLTAPLGPAVAPTSVTQHALAGSGQGTYKTGDAVPDAGREYHLDGSGTFAGLGPVKIHGTVLTPGLILGVEAGGTLTFSGPKGSVKVQLQALAKPGSPALWFRYQVVHGDGTFKQVTDQGTLRLDLRASPPTSAHPSASQQGTFSLRI